MQSLSYSYYNVWFKKQDMDTYTWKGHTKCMFWLNIKWPTIKTDKQISLSQNELLRYKNKSSL